MISDHFKSSLGTKLKTHKWMVDSPIADILFVHGFGEHSQRYFSEANFFNQHKLNFLAYDQRTHGESEGKTRAYIKDFDNYTKEFGEFVNQHKDQNRPYFLMSHSMGGLVTLSYLLKTKVRDSNFKGVIFSSPFLMPNKDTAPILQKLAGLIALIAPKLRTVKIDKKDISRDPKEQDSYVNDPLNFHGGIYAKSGATLIKQMKSIRSDFHTFKDPFIIQHGTIDQLAEFDGSQALYDESISEDKTFIPLKGFHHEITRDLGFEKVRQTYLDWVMERVHNS